jgi:hypothetical protein
MMKSWNSKGDTVLSVRQYLQKINHSTSITSIVEEKVVEDLYADWCAPTITPELLDALSLTKKPKGLQTIYETPLLPGPLDVKLSPPVVQEKSVHLQGVVYAASNYGPEMIYAYGKQIQEMINKMAAAGPYYPPVTYPPVTFFRPSVEYSDKDKLAAAEALEKAADLLLFKGWVKGALFEEDAESVAARRKKHNENQLLITTQQQINQMHQIQTTPTPPMTIDNDMDWKFF